MIFLCTTYVFTPKWTFPHQLFKSCLGIKKRFIIPLSKWSDFISHFCILNWRRIHDQELFSQIIPCDYGIQLYGIELTLRQSLWERKQSKTENIISYLMNFEMTCKFKELLQVYTRVIGRDTRVLSNNCNIWNIIGSNSNWVIMFYGLII